MRTTRLTNQVAHALLVVALIVAILACSVSSALAATPAPAWAVRAVPAASSFVATTSEPLTRREYVLLVTNVGDRASEGPVVVHDRLPAGITTAGTPQAGQEWSCTPAGEGQSEVTCTTEASIPALYSPRKIVLPVHVSEAAVSTSAGQVTVSGGVGGCGEPGAPPCPRVATTQTSPVGSIQAFEPLQFESDSLAVGGEYAQQAGAHPNSLYTAFTVPTQPVYGENELVLFEPAENVKQIVVDLPPGAIADARAAPTCPLVDVTSVGFEPAACPPASAVGTLNLLLPGPNVDRLTIFNVTPEHGYPAEFGVYIPSVERSVLLYGTLGPGPGYASRLISAPADRVLHIDGITATFFGDPGSVDAAGLSPMPFFTSPSDCQSSGFATSVHVDTWQNPGAFNADGTPDFSDPNWKGSSSTEPPVSGCEALQFHPTLSAQPTNTAPDSPTGLNVEMKFPQNEDPTGLATPPLKDATVTLPRGLVLSPSQATGLQACSNEQIALASNAPGTCPAASQIATVTVRTPILEETLPGQVFLGTPECNPCTNADAQDGKLARLFIQIHSERYGLTIKLAGTVSIDPATGQLTATFDNNPQQPVEDLKLQFPEGPRAALSTPNSCGTYTTTSDLVPWSSPQTPDATPSSSFGIGCASNAFGPSFTAGTSNPQAGAYSPFSLTFSRNDGEQDFSDVEQTLPPGLLAKLAGVQQCGNAEAASGNCPAGSRIGSVTVGAGPGSQPFYTSGSIYLTGPYNGGPFGEVVVVQAVAGPFNLGTVVVRGAIRINDKTAQASVVSDPFPTMLAGIPLQIRTVNVNLERPGFVFNPTNCGAKAVTGKLVSTQGTGANLSSPYEATNCASLAFKPDFTASAAGRASKAGGASFTVKFVAHGGPEGGETNFKLVKIDLPKQLPSRLTTLQKACLAATFEANPASCPAASAVGTAIVRTPALSSPLAGPVYLVSHGGEAFPDVEMVLQGEGITLIEDGKTQIKKGITSSTFSTTPDAPISSFEAKFPTGKYSLLGTNLPGSAKYSLCGQTLSMPTELVGQNGAVVKQTTKIAVTNCAKPKAKKKATAKKSSHAHNNGRKS